MDRITFKNLEIQDGDIVLMVHAGDIPIASLHYATKTFNGFVLEHKKDTLLLIISERDLVRKDTLQITNEGERAVFASGKKVDVYKTAIGIAADGTITSGYDMPFPSYAPKLSEIELVELSTHMICRWIKVMRMAKGEME